MAASDEVVSPEGDEGEQRQQDRRGAGDGRVGPLALGLDAEVAPDLFERDLDGSVSFQGKWCKFQTDVYQRLYQAAEIKSRSTATRWTWMTRRRASETLWLMVLGLRQELCVAVRHRRTKRQLDVGIP